MTYKNSIIGSSLAFIIATSCCWLPALIIGVGGGSALLGFSKSLEKYSFVFLLIGVSLLGLSIFQYNRRRKLSKEKVVVLQSIISCPKCHTKNEETMPTDVCQYFYECTNCKTILKPKEGDCCVFCSYGTVDCPPIQLNEECC